MNVRRDELIALAAETLGCEGQTAHGHWIYRDEPTGLWMVTDKAMHRLGQLVKQHGADAYEKWCDWATATEVDVGLIVRNRDFTGETDLDLAQSCALESDEIAAFLLLKFYRDDVDDTIRINEEIDRDNENREAAP